MAPIGGAQPAKFGLAGWLEGRVADLPSLHVRRSTILHLPGFRGDPRAVLVCGRGVASHTDVGMSRGGAYVGAGVQLKPSTGEEVADDLAMALEQ